MELTIARCGVFLMIIRALFTKKNYLRYISHLDLVRLFHRTFKRSQIPIKYSEGFNPHPKFSIANPLSLGIESEGEYIDIDLVYDMPIEEFIDRINKALPEDIQIIKAVYLEKENSISSMIKWAFYEIKFQTYEDIALELISERIDSWSKEEEILITRLKKKGRIKVPTEVNIVPLIGNVVLKGRDDDGFIVVNALLRSGEDGNLKPIDFIEAMNRDLELGIDMDSVMLKREALFAENEGNIYSPL